uniref:CSON006765 protein n=1 Tax=Culicoides sonorensis TaxID=179676 RepID=A0A336LA02_CULSO
MEFYENNESNSLYQGKDRDFLKKFDIAYIIIEIICTFLTIFGNSLVLLVFWHERNKNTSQKLIYKYVISMALADLLYGLIGIPLTIFVSFGHPKQRFLCLASILIQTMFGMVSVLALVAASTAKYLSLAHPLWFSTKFTENWVNVHITIHWIIGTLVGWLPSLGLNNAPIQTKVLYRNITENDSYQLTVISDAKNECLSNSTHVCYRDEFLCYFADIVPKQMSLILMFGIVLPSCLIMIVIYGLMYRILMKSMRSGRQKHPDTKISWKRIFLSLFNSCCTVETGPRQIGDLKTREARSTIVLMFTVLFFAFCWLPLYIIDAIFSLTPQDLHISVETINAFIALRHVNSVFNPFLYAYHMRGFKQASKNIFKKMFKSDQLELKTTLKVSSSASQLSKTEVKEIA